MTQEIFTDKRLLGALDYIDERFIAEVTEDYEAFEVPGVYKPNKRAHRRAYRQFAALAACLILLSAALPVVGNVLTRVGVSIGGWGGNAGAGSDVLETPPASESQTIETEPEVTQAEIIDSPYERAIDAYPADMPAEEIYADVLKGGWVVMDGMYTANFVSGEELWMDFIGKVNAEEPASILIADYLKYYISEADVEFNRLKSRKPTIFLMEIIFNGNEFSYKRLDCRTDQITDSGEYKYLITDIYECNTTTVNSESVNEQITTYCLTNNQMWTYEKFCNELWQNELSDDFINDRCQIVAQNVTAIEETSYEVPRSLIRSLGFSEINID